jgi:uncharacterized protein DUF4337
MSEVEIPHAHQVDDFGKRVGVLVAVLGVLLSVVTIASHREHTAAVVYRTESNDQWAFYQAKKIREYEAEVGATIVKSLSAEPAKTDSALQALSAQRDKYAKDAADIQKEAEERDSATHLAEARALRFDLGEGFLELGLVLSSLYFLARKKLFPAIGVAAAALGTVLAIWAFVI